MENGLDTLEVSLKDALPKEEEVLVRKSSAKTWVIGDPHGGLRAIQQCFDRSGIDRERDHLICIGDVADGWPDVAESLEELLTVKHLSYVIGNHDVWLNNYLSGGHAPNIWTSQGGFASIESYNNNTHLVKKHRDFYSKQPFYRVIDGNLYVHGGFYPLQSIEAQAGHDLMWDRDLWYRASEISKMMNQAKMKRSIKYSMHQINNYKEIFIGHTTTSRITIDSPVNYLNIWNVDQGGGFEGRLTIMNVDTKDFFQSDLVKTLYPGVRGR